MMQSGSSSRLGGTGMSEHTSGKTQADILVVDDTPANLRVLTGILKGQGYKTRPVPNGRLALQAAQSDPPDLILLDIAMPEIDGYEVCKQLKQDAQLREIPVIFISAHHEQLDKVKAFAVGGVDYITKPFHLEEVLARLETHLKLSQLKLELAKRNLHLEELVLLQVKELSDSQMATILALAGLAESRDDNTGKHLDRVQIFCRLLAAKLGESAPYQGTITPGFIENIHHASPLHDIGKVAIQDSILLKPAKLTTEEFEVMKSHPILGAQTLAVVLDRYPKNSFIRMGIDIAKFHHEKWDGSGYPYGLSGKEIPLSARMMAVADVYDALRSRRCYKQAYSHEESCGIISESRGGHFDPDVVEAFFHLQLQFKDVREKMAN